VSVERGGDVSVERGGGVSVERGGGCAHRLQLHPRGLLGGQILLRRRQLLRHMALAVDLRGAASRSAEARAGRYSGPSQLTVTADRYS
jgi:hypothetical protein